MTHNLPCGHHIYEGLFINNIGSNCIRFISIIIYYGHNRFAVKVWKLCILHCFLFWLYLEQVASQIIRYEHEGNWSSALEYYDLLVRSTPKENLANFAGTVLTGPSVSSKAEENLLNWKMHKGLMRSLQKTGCSHVLDIYSQGLTNQKACFQQDSEFVDIQVSIAYSR